MDTMVTAAIRERLGQVERVWEAWAGCWEAVWEVEEAQEAR